MTEFLKAYLAEQPGPTMEGWVADREFASVLAGFLKEGPDRTVECVLDSVTNEPKYIYRESGFILQDGARADPLDDGLSWLAKPLQSDRRLVGNAQALTEVFDWYLRQGTVGIGTYMSRMHGMLEAGRRDGDLAGCYANAYDTKVRDGVTGMIVRMVLLDTIFPHQIDRPPMAKSEVRVPEQHGDPEDEEPPAPSNDRMISRLAWMIPEVSDEIAVTFAARLGTPYRTDMDQGLTPYGSDSPASHIGRVLNRMTDGVFRVFQAHGAFGPIRQEPRDDDGDIIALEGWIHWADTEAPVVVGNDDPADD